MTERDPSLLLLYAWWLDAARKGAMPSQYPGLRPVRHHRVSAKKPPDRQLTATLSRPTFPIAWLPGAYQPVPETLPCLACRRPVVRELDEEYWLSQSSSGESTASLPPINKPALLRRLLRQRVGTWLVFRLDKSMGEVG